MPNKIAVVGASGFVGTNLVAHLAREGVETVAISRSAAPPAASVAVTLPDYRDRRAMRKALQGVDSVVLLAGRAHVLKDRAADPLAEFLVANRDIAVATAEAAADAGVRRFVFTSSIAVNGVETGSRPFSEHDAPGPVTHYGKSKHEAEKALLEIADARDLELCIVRPPMVYGRDAPGNFGLLMRLLRYRLPLPLGATDNLRSFIGVSNLASFLARCCEHENAAGRTFLVSDGEDVSTTTLLRMLGEAMSIRTTLLPFPSHMLRRLLNLAGRGALGQRLLGSLQVDSVPARTALAWTPPVALARGLKHCCSPETDHGYL